MKRIVLVIAGLLIGLTTAAAAEFTTKKEGSILDKTKRYRNTQPIVFLERGIEFLIFPNGTFDFNTYYNDAYYVSNSRRSTINASYNGPSVSVNYSSHNRGIHISRDRNGTIRSIGDVNLNYDRYGKITRIGSVFMDYSRGRNATLSQVGGLRVNYNHYGEIVNVHGQINSYNNNCNACGTLSCIVEHKYKKGHDNYHYKQNGKEKKYKK